MARKLGLGVQLDQNGGVGEGGGGGSRNFNKCGLILLNLLSMQLYPHNSLEKNSSDKFLVHNFSVYKLC